MTGLSMCFCSIVEFAREDDMKRAIRKLDGTELMGKRIRLIEVQCHQLVTNLCAVEASFTPIRFMSTYKTCLCK